VQKDHFELQIDEKQKLLDNLTNNYNILLESMETKEQEKIVLLEKLEELLIQIEKADEIMAEKLEKFRDFIKDKVEQLKELEFIDKEEYNELLMIKEESKMDEKFITFEEDLERDYQRAISHIHSYLFNLDIMYPRYILEDFMALIKTNDLIVLAGESGSGKTNLIKSFAQAIGGKSVIIPVKPNWTSSEDLLGYYNPLEKKYLSTPFLEALFEAKNNPDIPYFICLDEMNLARIEYYFADFLSLLEERNSEVKINLYSDNEASHVLSELKNVLDIISTSKEKYQKNNLIDFLSILRDEEINAELKRVFGFSDKDSLIKYHTDLRKMISGLISTPSSITFPKNVRIIGAINIDETTHYLSPKILDRAHIMKFDSPLLYDWIKIAEELEENDNKDSILKFSIDDLGLRESYPKFSNDDEFCQTIALLTKEYFSPLGIEVGLRTIRQGLNYKKIFIEQNSDATLVINNFILHKILPKMTFDGSKKVQFSGREEEKIEVLRHFMNKLKEYIEQDNIQYEKNNSIKELEHIIKNSDNNNKIVNYWA
jgi:MoxR-like ATPase